MSWIETNFIPGSRSYVLNAPESERYWDSLHHTCMIWAGMRLSICAHVNLPQAFGASFTYESQKFILSEWKLIRSWSQINPIGGWLWPITVSRDQYLAFILACSIYDTHEKACRELFYTLARNWFFYPNTYAIKDGKLIEKKWYQPPDIAWPWHIGDYQRATGLWYLWPFRLVSDIAMPFEALVAALNKNHTDHVKMVVRFIWLDIEGNYLAKLASWIFIKLRRNGKRTNDGFVIDSYAKGHPILNMWQCYWREDAGHAREVYELSEPLLKWWIGRYK